MNVIATTRQTQGTSASRRLRRADKVPGIIYGGATAATSIELDHNPLFHALRKEKFHASILTMELDGKEELVLLRSFQMHAYKPQVLHIDFQRVAADKPVHMRVPLHFVGQEESPAVKLSHGLVSHVKSEVEIACLPRDLPEFVTVDLSELKANESVRATDLKLPTGVSVVIKGKENPVLVSVTTKGGTADAEATPAADAAAPASKAPAKK
ncbi:MAG: 50S ribosomal protein L25/general stress protein Ctc [Burkholderiaceae bacterium]